ncbi:protein kinase domain-containing protein [Demetria terragena]|uniref:protein kinase domain-containing protein n=1 Tax=Demetria terragena TaxID=63959 RepID=UPI0003A136C9|nr:protein kinase [Demetria terragena]
MASDARSTGPLPEPATETSVTRGHRLPASGAVLGGRSGSAGAVRADPTREDPTEDLTPGAEMLGPYLLMEQVGQGGMGVVYRAVDRDGAEVAVKVLRPHIAHDDGARDRLRREVSTLSRVRDDRVAPVLDADIDGPTPYLVTRFVPGSPLDDVVAERGALSPDQLVRLGRGLAEALGAIHAAGVVHRDLKPGNVLMVGDEPVLIDFGIAHVADDIRLTMTGMVMGTPGYLSPEVVDGGSVTEATDWWGWAATLAYAASGQAPFGRGPMPVVLDRVGRGQSDLSGVDERLRPLLESALSPVPGQRPSATTVLSEMEQYAAGRHTTSVPLRSPSGATPSTQSWVAQPTSGVEATPQTRAQPVQQADPTAHLPAAHATSVQPVSPQPVAPEPDPYARGPQLQPPPPRNQPPQQWQSGQPDPRIGRPARTWSLAMLLVALLGLTALAPAVALMVLMVWSLTARWVDRAMTAMVFRRYNQGVRRSDGVVAVLSSPWHGIRALVAAVFTALLPAFLGAITAVTVALLGSLVNGSSPQLDVAPPWMAGTVVAALVMWWGPGGTSMRRGSRSMVRGALRTQPVTVIGLAVCAMVGLGGLLISLQNGFTVDWWPMNADSSWLRGDWIPSLS